MSSTTATAGQAAAPPPPPPENRAAQALAVNGIEGRLAGQGWLHSVSHEDAEAAAEQLSRLSGPDAGKVIDRLQGDGQLAPLAAKLVDGGGLFHSAGLSQDEQRSFLNGLAGKLDGPHLATLQRAFAAAGGDHEQDVAQAVAAHASPEAKTGFVKAEASAGAGQEPQLVGHFGSLEARYSNADSRAAATVLSSTRGGYAAEAFGALSPPERRAVFSAAADARSFTFTSGGEAPASTMGSVDARGFDGLMRAASSISDSKARAAAVGSAADFMRETARSSGMDQATLAPLANSALRSLDGPALAQLKPDQAAGLAATAASGDPRELAATANGVAALPASPARDATVRTLFLKTDGQAYAGQPALARAMGGALARTETADPAQAAPLGAAYARMLSTPEGRAFLADPKVDAGSRLTAAAMTARDPAETAKMIAGQDKPWETPAVALAFARPAVERMASTRGNAATTLQGGSDMANFVGTSLGAPLKDTPRTEAEAATEQAQAAQGQRSLYQDVPAVQKPAQGLRDAQAQMGGGPIKVSVLPVGFSSQEGGAYNLDLYRAEGANGQSRYVDNQGRVYQDFGDWKANNALPAGKMTYPADGRLGAPGETRLQTDNTPKANRAGWDRTVHGAALVGATAAGVLLIAGTDGLATPVAVGLWGLAGGSAVVTGADALNTLHDRGSHDQSLSLADPDARAAWLSLGGSVLTVAGGGAGKLAEALGEGRAATGLARASGVLNTAANYADTAATANGAIDLGRNWSSMTPGQRTEAGLQLAFWAGMRGLSTHSAGQGLDGYSFRQQIAHAGLDTGTSVRANPALGPNDASVVTTRGATGRVQGVQVEHGPEASPAVVDAHTATARDVVRASGPDAALARAATGRGSRPGSYGEQTQLEVAKHESLLKRLDQSLAEPRLAPADRQTLTAQRADAAHDLDFYRSQAAEAARDPTLANGPADRGGDIEVKEKNTHWLDVNGALPRSASANGSWERLQTGLAQSLPDARPIAVGRDGVTLPDHTTVANTGGDGRKGGVNLRQFVTPQDRGGYGGQVFYDAKSGSLVLAVNMASKSHPGEVQRLEVPYTRNAAGEWRPDFSQYSPYSTSIDASLPAKRGVHFAQANRNLTADWNRDPTIKAKLHLNAANTEKVVDASPESPDPYTWDHVDGSGRMRLVDSAVHGLFLHEGGFSEWGK